MTQWHFLEAEWKDGLPILKPEAFPANHFSGFPPPEGVMLPDGRSRGDTLVQAGPNSQSVTPSLRPHHLGIQSCFASSFSPQSDERWAVSLLTSHSGLRSYSLLISAHRQVGDDGLISQLSTGAADPRLLLQEGTHSGSII